MNKRAIRASCLLFFPLALLAGSLLFFSACIDPKDDPEINPPKSPNQFTDCLPMGQPCGGKKLCCSTGICKGGVCRSDGSCTGRNSHCSSTADCCGTLLCRDTICK